MEPLTMISILGACAALLAAWIAVWKFYQRNFVVRNFVAPTYISAESRLNKAIITANKEIAILGVTLSSIFERPDSPIFRNIMKAAQRGVKIKFLLLSPEVEVPRDAPESMLYTDHARFVLENSISGYRQILKKYPYADVQLRLYRNYTTFFLILIDDVFCLSSDRHHPGSKDRSYNMTISDHFKLKLLKRQFERLWESSETVKP